MAQWILVKIRKIDNSISNSIFGYSAVSFHPSRDVNSSQAHDDRERKNCRSILLGTSAEVSGQFNVKGIDEIKQFFSKESWDNDLQLKAI